ncbi:MAG: cobyrinate a,c-diamide synthase [Nitrospirota bacterium]
MQGFVIAGTHSGCGKTTVTLGILAALRRRGCSVQSFKAGPDFIDAGLHRLITGRASRNLDLWMCGEESVIDCFDRHTGDADIAVVEGVMGLYDGEQSTAALARVLRLPVVLVVDAYGMAESAGAIVQGFARYGADASSGLIAGVLFNRVASESHYARLKESVRDVPVLGCLPRSLDFEIPHRHLGLATAEEHPIARENIGKLADTVLRYIDMDALVARADLSMRGSGVTPPCLPLPKGRSEEGLPSTIKIAVAYDKAFCFYYEDNLDLLRAAGAEIVPFSPLADSALPDAADALYIGGGYPELYAAELARNGSLRAALAEWSGSGRPLYAECGGLMYLSRGIHAFDGSFFPMVGTLPFETVMKKGRAHLGYRKVVLDKDCILGKKGEECRGHEFHYSEIKKSAEASSDLVSSAYSVQDRSGHAIGAEGYSVKNTLASYIHIHFGSNPGIPERFITFAKETVTASWKA